MGKKNREEEPTIFTAKYKRKNGLQAEQVQEIPRKTRHPSDIKITSHNTRLEHGLEANREREGQSHYLVTVSTQFFP